MILLDKFTYIYPHTYSLYNYMGNSTLGPLRTKFQYSSIPILTVFGRAFHDKSGGYPSPTPPYVITLVYMPSCTPAYNVPPLILEPN